MISRSRLFDIMLLAVVLLVLTSATHFWISDRLGVLRALYPLQAFVANFSVQCSGSSPQFLSRYVGSLIHDLKSTTNQVVYISADGEVSSCVSGWLGPFLLSSSISGEERFRYASLTKLVTAEAVLALVRRGRIKLDTPLSEIIPELKYAKDQRVLQITVEMLLNHSAGFDRYETADPLFEHYEKPWCYYEPSYLARVELDYDPGSKQVYSNVGYCLLAEVIGVVSGVPYRTHIEEQFDLSVRNMKFIVGPYFESEVVYDFRNSDFYGPNYYKYFDFSALASSAGLSGNAMMFAALLQDISRMGSPNILETGAKESCDASVIRNCYGWAFYIYEPEGVGRTFLVQEGFLPGVSSLAIVDDSGAILVSLSGGAPLNGYEVSGEFIERAVRNLQHYAEIK